MTRKQFILTLGLIGCKDKEIMGWFETLPNPHKVMVGTQYSELQKIFNTWGVGGFIFAPFDDSVNYNNDDVEQYLTGNVDFTALADQVASLGYIDYVIIHAKNEPGFCWWPTQTLFNGGVPITYNSQTIPVYGGNDFHIGNSHYTGLGITDDHLERFISAFMAKGIKAGFYYPIGRDYRIRTELSNAELQNSADPAIYGKYDEYHEFVKGQLVELVQWYNPDLIWLDNVTKHPWLNNSGASVRWENHQSIYTAVKAANRRVLVDCNLNVGGDGDTLFTDGKLQYFPIDVIGMEQDAAIVTGEYAEASTHDGVDYLIPKEKLYDGLYNDTQTKQYRWWDPADPDKQGININSIRTQQNFQDAYNANQALGVTTMFNLPPQPGTWLIDSTYFSRLQNLIL